MWCIALQYFIHNRMLQLAFGVPTLIHRRIMSRFDTRPRPLVRIRPS
jgi:hypothetical protein